MKCSVIWPRKAISFSWRGPSLMHAPWSPANECEKRARRRSAVHRRQLFCFPDDLLVGMLFIFIILLMAFALSYQSAESDLHTQNRRASGRTRAQRASLRASLLDTLGVVLTEQGIKVKVDAENGVLRPPEKTLFASGSADLGPPGHQALQILATRLARSLTSLTLQLRASSGNALRDRKLSSRPSTLRVIPTTCQSRLRVCGQLGFIVRPSDKNLPVHAPSLAGAGRRSTMQTALRHCLGPAPTRNSGQCIRITT